MGAYAKERARVSSRAEPLLPRVLRQLEIGAWLLTIVGACFGAYALYANIGPHEGDATPALVYAVALAVIPYVLARAIASLRRSLH